MQKNITFRECDDRVVQVEQAVALQLDGCQALCEGWSVGHRLTLSVMHLTE